MTGCVASDTERYNFSTAFVAVYVISVVQHPQFNTHCLAFFLTMKNEVNNCDSDSCLCRDLNLFLFKKSEIVS